MPTPAEAGSLILSAYDNRRLRQGVYRETDESGATYVNIVGAMGDTVLSAEQTPTDVWPIWMGYLCAGLFDAQDEQMAFDWARSMALQMAEPAYATIEWDTVKVDLLLRAVDQANLMSSAGQVAERISVPSLYLLTRPAVETQSGLVAALSLGALVAQQVDGVARSAVEAMMWACKSPVVPSAGLDTTIANQGVNACLAASAEAASNGRNIQGVRSQQAVILLDLIEQQL